MPSHVIQICQLLEECCMFTLCTVLHPSIVKEVKFHGFQSSNWHFLNYKKKLNQNFKVYKPTKDHFSSNVLAEDFDLIYFS